MLDFSSKFRQHLRLIWEVSALDQEGLSEEDQLLVEIMQLVRPRRRRRRRR